MRVLLLHKQKECRIYECSDRIFMHVDNDEAERWSKRME